MAGRQESVQGSSCRSGQRATSWMFLPALCGPTGPLLHFSGCWKERDDSRTPPSPGAYRRTALNLDSRYIARKIQVARNVGHTSCRFVCFGITALHPVCGTRLGLSEKEQVAPSVCRQVAAVVPSHTVASSSVPRVSFLPSLPLPLPLPPFALFHTEAHVPVALIRLSPHLLARAFVLCMGSSREESLLFAPMKRPCSRV